MTNELAGLADHINPDRRAGHGLFSLDITSGLSAAMRITVDPQAHIDALVAAGVLHRHRASRGTGKPDRVWYNTNSAVYPTPAHEHDWVVGSVGFTGKSFERTVLERCKDEDCPGERRRTVDPRTIVVPE